MAQKIFKQNFASDYGGINGERSAIEADGNDVNRAVNYEYAVGNSLRGRVGCQVAGSPGGFFALFPYSYTRTTDEYVVSYATSSGVHPAETGTLTTTKVAADGATINKTIAINEQIWSLENFTIPVTRVSGTYPFTWYTRVNGSFVNFVIKANGVSILDFPMADGVIASTSIYSLLAQIDATAELSISRTTRGTCPPFALSDGAQTTNGVGFTDQLGNAYRVFVRAGHNFLPGDIITFNSSILTGGVVLGTAAGYIDYWGAEVSLADGEVIGYLGQSACAFPIATASSASSGTLNMVFPYWKLIPQGDRNQTNLSRITSSAVVEYGRMFNKAYTLWQNKSAGSFYAPATSVSTNGNLYITTSATPSQSGDFANALIKCDGRTAVRAGLPKITSATITTPGAGVLTGAYKYKFLLRRYDAQGNIIEGPLLAPTSVTAAGTYSSLSIVIPGYGDYTGFQTRSAVKNTTEAPAIGAYFYIDNGSNTNVFIYPGDPIHLTDNVIQKSGGGGANTGVWKNALGGNALGALHKTVCTAWDGTNTAIKVADSSGYTILDNTAISTGLNLVGLRTAAGGNQYYELFETPITGNAGAFTCLDNVNDSILTAGIQYQEVTLGKEHDAPALCTLVCQHQGGLATARGPLTPNTVGFSSADGIEYFPVASNSFDVPSTQSGLITAIASDTVDRLAVFKDRAYYDVVGDLDGGNFSVNVKNEGDYGIVSQASLVRVHEKLIGLSRNGFVLINDGNLAYDSFRGLSARVINRNYNFAWTTAVNDSFNRCYICSVPVPSAEPATFVIDYSREQNHTFERSYTTKIDPVGGMAMNGDTLYHLSSTTPYAVFRRLYRFNGDSPNIGNGDSFLDNINAISYILESQPINNDEPDVLNTPVRCRVWSIPNDYVIEGWVPFSLLVEGGASPIAAYVGGTSPGATSSTITFATANDIFKDVKLVPSKTHFYIMRFTTNAVRTAPFITGYDILYSESYKKEDLVK